MSPGPDEFDYIRDEWRAWLALLPGYDCFKNASAYYFDEDAADFVCEFFETRLHHVEGDLEGQLIKLEPWQRAFLGAIFGWKRKSDGLRRYRKVLLYIPRKNSKTTIVAGIVLLMMACEDEGGQQIYFGAADREQARITKTIAEKMISYDDDLANMMKVLNYSIETKDRRHICRVLSKAPRGKHGKNCNCALFDELHEFESGKLCEDIESSMGARSQPLTIFTTTADYVRESKCNDTRDYFAAVRDGTIEDAEALPVIYETSHDADVNDHAVWAKVNPNLGVSVKPEFLEAEFRKALLSKRDMAKFKRLYLNMRTQTATDWIDINEWDACSGLVNETPKAWRERILAACVGKKCWGGLDLGSVSDLTSYGLLFDGADCGYRGALVIVPFFWTPEESIPMLPDLYRWLYESWVDDGFLITTAGNVMDFNDLQDQIVKLNKKYPMLKAFADVAFQGHQLSIALQNDHGIKVEGFAQSFTNYDTPTKDLDARIQNKTIIHGGNPVLRHQASHVMVAEDRNQRIKPVKESINSPKKVDGIQCTVMALGSWHMRDKNKPRSRYNDPDVKPLVLGGTR